LIVLKPAGRLYSASFIGKVVETWVGFISADNKEVFTSIYTGQVTVLYLSLINVDDKKGAARQLFF
jgi:hypothetical protein